MMIDCFNKGGQWDEGTDQCVFVGTCSEDTGPCDTGANECAFVDDGFGNNANECDLAYTCHDQPLDSNGMDNFEPPGPADSQFCEPAIDSSETIFDCSL